MPLDISLLGDDNFISQYVDYYWNLSGGIREFKYAAALVLLGMLTDRKVVLHLNLARNVYTNAWLMVLGKSGESHKSTAFTEAEGHINVIFGSQIKLPTMFSREAIPLTMRDNAHRVLMDEDVGGLLEGMSKTGSYLKAFTDDMCKYYDCPPEHVKKTVKEEFVIKDIFLNVLMSTTPTRFSQSIGEAELDGGLFSRFLLITDTSSSENRKMKARHISNDEYFDSEELNRRLLQIKKSISLFSSIEFQCSGDAIAEYNEWVDRVSASAENDYLKMILSRMQMYVFKLSSLYYVGSDEFIDDADKAYHDILQRYSNDKNFKFVDGMGSGMPTVMQVPDRFIGIAMEHIEKYFIPTSTAVYEEVVKRSADSTTYKVLRRLKDAEKYTMTRSQLLTALSGQVKAAELNAILEVLEGEGIVNIFRSEGRNGREKWVIVLTKLDAV